MGFFSGGKYTDRDGDVHNIKNIPDFGVRGNRRAPVTMSDSQARADSRIARKNHKKAMAAQAAAEEKARKIQAEKARQKRLREEEKAAKKAAKKRR